MYKIDDLCRILKQTRDLQLENAAVLDKYPLSTLQQICNGVGPDAFPEKLRNIITLCRRELESAAMIHDVEFFEGGSRADFHTANARLSRNGRTVADALYHWYDPRRYLNRGRAARAGMYCDLFGCSSWNEK